MINLTTRHFRSACSTAGILLVFMIFFCAQQWNVPTINKAITRIESRGPVILVNPLPATVPGSSDPNCDEWPMSHHSLNRTGETTTIIQNGTKPIWNSSVISFPTDPIVADGRVYTGGSSDHSLYCLNATTGAMIWSNNTGNTINRASAYTSGLLYTPIGYNVECVNATNGRLKWTYATANWVQTSPAVANGRVYFGSDDSKIYCLNATNGSKIWSYTAGSFVRCSPAIADGWIFIGSIDRKLYCLNATNGAFHWSFTTGGWLQSMPAVVNALVYVSSQDHWLYCLYVKNGTCKWSYRTNNDVSYSSPAIFGDRVYIGSCDTKFYCLNATKGNMLWTKQMPNQLETSPAIADGFIYLDCLDSRFYCLNLLNGLTLWSCQDPLGSSTFSAAAIANGRIYVSCGGYVYCLPMVLLPPAPIILTATPGNHQVTLSWTPPAQSWGTTDMNYKVYRSTSTGSEVLIRLLGNVTNWTDTGLTNGVQYYYKISAVSNAGEGPLSKETSAMPMGAPESPYALTAVPSNAQVNLSWLPPLMNGGAAITGYHLYMGTTMGGETAAGSIGNVTSHLITSLINGQAYYFKVAAINGVGTGTNSSEASATPSTLPTAPQSLAATGGIKSIAVTWTAPSGTGGSAILGYRIYRGNAMGAETWLVDVGPVLSYNDTGLLNNSTCYYKVQARNANGYGPNSTEISAMTATVPSRPLNSIATPGNGLIHIGWILPSNNGGSPITNYTIFKGTSSGKETFFETLGNVTYCSITGLINFQKYYFVIAAVNAIGTGANSTEINGNPVASIPTAPLTLTATSGDFRVILSWTTPESDGGSPILYYKIYRSTTPGNEVAANSWLETNGNSTTAEDRNIPAGITYYYRICAVNLAGDGALSNEASATPSSTPTPNPIDPHLYLTIGIICACIAAPAVAIAVRKRRRKKSRAASSNDIDTWLES